MISLHRLSSARLLADSGVTSAGSLQSRGIFNTISKSFGTYLQSYTRARCFSHALITSNNSCRLVRAAKALIAISCSRRDAAQLHFDRAVIFDPQAKQSPCISPAGPKLGSNDTTSDRAPPRDIVTDTASSMLWSLLSVKPRAEGEPTSNRHWKWPLEHITFALLFAQSEPSWHNESDRTDGQDMERALGEHVRGRPLLEAAPPSRSFHTVIFHTVQLAEGNFVNFGNFLDVGSGFSSELFRVVRSKNLVMS